MSDTVLPDYDLYSLAAKWQAILRLRDWDLQIQWARSFDMPPNTQGRCSFVVKKKAALIKILEPRDFPTDISWPQDVECTVVHELLHLHFAAIDELIGTVGDVVLEQAVESIAKALVALGRQPIAL